MMLTAKPPVNIMESSHAAFERCWPWLAAALEHGGNTHRKEDLRHCIEDGSAQLHPLPHGAMVTTIQTHPSGIKDAVIWLGGGNLEEILQGVPLLEVWMRSEGCQRVIISGRTGWLRKFPSYRHTGVTLIKDLT